MNNSEMVSLFYGCRYDADKNRIHWDNASERVYVLLDADGRASSGFVSYECDDGGWTDWRILPSSFCDYVNAGLSKASSLGIALNDISRAVLDSDLQSVVLI